MPLFPLKIRFTDAERAGARFHSFPPDYLDYVAGWSRKRAGASQLILLVLTKEKHLEDLFALCRHEDGIVEVASITETEFHTAKSEAV